MAAGRRAGDADAFGINVELFRMGPQEANRRLAVVDLGRVDGVLTEPDS